MAGRHGKGGGAVSSLLQNLFGKEGTQTGNTSSRTPDAQTASLKDALPDILEMYIVTDPGQDQQQELVSVLRLITHACKKLPGVFGHGNGNSILPVIGRLIPLFASPIFRGKGTSLLDAFSALLSLLQSADITTYIQVINDTVHLVEDFLSLASFFSSSSSFTLSTTVSLQVFNGAFEYASKMPRGEDCMAAPQFWLNGITVKLSGSHQVLPFAEWAIWLLGHILEKGDHFVAGMIPQSTLVSLGQLMSLSDSRLHKVCFQTFKVASLSLPAETVPKGDIVLSLLSILSASSNNSELPAFRSVTYDSALASCLAAVVAGADRSLYVYSAQAWLEVFPRAIVMTKCQELKVTAGAAFASLLRHCPELSHQIHRAFSLLHLPEMSLILSQMIQDYVESHAIFLQGGGCKTISVCDNSKESGVVGKRLSQEITDDKEALSGVEQGQQSKRRKIGLEITEKAEQSGRGIGFKNADPGPPTAAFQLVEGEYHVDSVYGSDETIYKNILETIHGVAPDAIPGRYTEEGALTVLRVIAKAFSRLPGTDCWLAALGCLEKWITYGVYKARQAALSNPLLALTFEAIEKILPPRKEETKAWVKLSSATGSWNPAEVFELLRLPWERTLVPGNAAADPLLKMKVRALRLASCLQVEKARDALDQILNLGLADSNARVRAAAVQAVTKVAPDAGETKILEYCRTLRMLATDKDSTVLERVAECIGSLECSTTPEARQRSPLEAMGPFKAMDTIPCLVCCEARGRYDRLGREKEAGMGQISVVPLTTWSPLLEQLLIDAAAGEHSLTKLQVQVIKSLPKLVRHGRVDELSSRSEFWWQCMQNLPVHPERPVRAAFCGIAASLLSTIAYRRVSVSTPLLSSVGRRGRSDGDIEAQGRRTSMQLLSSLEEHLHACNQACEDAERKGKHAHHCVEADKIKGLLVAIKEIAGAVPWIPSLEPRCILDLIGQLDNQHSGVRVAAAAALKHASRGESPATPENEQRHARLLFERWKQEIADYLCDRLVTRPKVAEEFAASVLRWPLPSLIRNIITEGMSKQVLAAAGAGVENTSEDRQQEAMAVLACLATWKGCSVEVLLKEYSYMPLAAALLRKDPKVVEVVEEFYVREAKQSKRTILLNSQRGIVKALVLYMDKDTEADKERSAMVVPALQRLAKICTGSDNLPDFLKTHFPEVLYYMGVMLAETDPFRKERTLRVVGRMMELIGPHIGAFVPNIMVILANGARNSEYVGQALANLLAFVKTLAKRAPHQLQSVAGRIVGAIMPTLISSQKKDAESGAGQGKQGGVEDHEGGAQHLEAAVLVLGELLVKNRRLLEGQLTKVPLLHDVPELADINAVLKDARSQLTLRGHFMMACEALGNENLSVRRLGARELYEFLHHRREAVSFPESGDGSEDPDGVSQLLETLLRCCTEELSSGPQTAQVRKAGDRDEGHLVRTACALCLGELGAIDPAKLQLQAQQRPRLGNSDQELVWDLITVQLMKPLRAASGVATQNAARLAVQQLLEMSGCTAALVGQVEPSGRGENNADLPDMEGGRKLWSRFSEDVKALISPYLTTKFVLNTTVLVAPGPIFNRQESYGRWLYLWIKKLVSQCPNRRGRLLHSCQGVVKHDVDIALYILPYCVLNVVCEGSEEALDGVKQEIETVLAEGGKEAEGAWSAAGWDNSGAPGSSRNKEGSSTFTGDEAVEVSTQTIFTLLDSLGQWLDDAKMSIATLRSRKSHLQTTSKGSDAKLEEEIKRQDSKRAQVERLLTAVPVSSRALAWASYRCGARARALRYFETDLRSKNKESGTLNPAAAKSGFFEDKDVSQLLELYSEMEEPDGLIGISKLREPSCSPDQSLHDQVSIQEQEGNWAQALTCYEQGLDEMDCRASAARHGGQLNCLLNMGHLQAMITHVDGLLVRQPEYAREWSARGVQAAWRLGQWDRLDQYITRFEETEESGSLASSSPEFEVGLARMIRAMKRGEGQTFYGYLREAREGLLAPLAAAAMESYSRAYPILLKLHMLRELSDCGSFGVFGGEGDEERLSGAEHRSVPTLLREWEQRLEVTQPSLGIREPILALRRVVCTTGGLQAEVGASWLQYANMCRKVGHMQTASRAILQARHHKAPLVYMEAAKLNWANKQTHTAIAELEGVLQTHQRLLTPKTVEALGFLPVPNQAGIEVLGGGGAEEKREVAKALLLLTRWVHHTGQKQKQQVLNLYTQVHTLQPEWEKAFFCLARYYDDLYVDAKHRQSQGGEEQAARPPAPRARLPKDDKIMWYTYQVEAIQTYAKALLKGHKYIFQSLPRLLTLWFDFASWFIECHPKPIKALQMEQKKVDDVFIQLSRGLPTYKWLTAMPQLVSRICHRSPKVVEPLKRILVQILQDHPQQALWSMAAVSKSTLDTRMKVATQIIQAARKGLRTNQDIDLFEKFPKFIDQMIKLCFLNVDKKVKILKLSSAMTSLLAVMPLDAAMPVQRALTVTLPAKGATATDHNPFHSGWASISSIRDEVEVLQSLQKPKKVVLVGSDGVEYPFLCKPKDDLRKDARMMEFCGMLNRLLTKDAGSRRRNLYIRTFAVIPLTEESGMIEWVPHLKGLRNILQDLYLNSGHFDRLTTNPRIKRAYDASPPNQEAKLLREAILPTFPPIFHTWFLHSFPEPAAWFRARLGYAHTTAVWSMVGHIVGLGDRHGENILFDSHTGDCCHVDFSCLFDKGLALEKPELVPFRLTQNMVDGLGISGYEGVFVRVCDITLSVLRNHRESLMSALETFLHDPLVEWTKPLKPSPGEVENPHAQRALASIEARLQGVVVGVGAAPSLPLSVEGQVHRLIAEAVSLENLGKMYIWWMPWF